MESMVFHVFAQQEQNAVATKNHLKDMATPHAMDSGNHVLMVVFW
jgi:hypothetical protein